jgi:shikimate dehydrogenase
MEAHESISGRTGVLGVLGHPVGHSLSPRIHNAALAAQGLDMVYVAFDVPPLRLADAVLGLRGLGFRGANVTIPHKEAIIGLLDEVEPIAARIGAVNTVVNDGNRLVGHNTDRSGFAAILRGVRAEGAQGLVCLVAGAGGAARAVVAALSANSPREIRVHNRSHERAVRLCTQARAWGTSSCIAVDDQELRAAAQGADLIVNATSVGLDPLVKESAVPVDILLSHHIVVDLVYGAGPTMLVREAKARGATAVDGKEMLVMQAADSYELWTGLRPPLDVMRRSIDGWER